MKIQYKIARISALNTRPLSDITGQIGTAKLARHTTKEQKLEEKIYYRNYNYKEAGYYVTT